MANGYWDQALNGRISRRRAIAATGATALGAAFLAARGGSDSGGSSSSGGGGDKSSLLAKREDTSKQAKTGGTLITTNPADPPHFDPHLLTLPAAMATSLIYNKLFSVKPGVLQASDGTIEGDMVESWEFSPDKLTLTMKIRGDAGTPPNQAPVNGRKLAPSCRRDCGPSWTPQTWSTHGPASQQPAAAVQTLRTSPRPRHQSCP